jgi:hypothetical protein
LPAQQRLKTTGVVFSSMNAVLTALLLQAFHCFKRFVRVKNPICASVFFVIFGHRHIRAKPIFFFGYFALLMYTPAQQVNN